MVSAPFPPELPSSLSVLPCLQRGHPVPLSSPSSLASSKREALESEELGVSLGLATHLVDDILPVTYLNFVFPCVK